MKKLLAWLMAVTLTFQLVPPVFAEEIEETQAATEAAEMETEAPTTEIPTTEPTTIDAMETAAPEETSAPAEPQTTVTTEATETMTSTEETTSASTEPTEETTEPTLDLFAEDGNVIASGTCGYNGDNLTWVLTKDGILTISGSGEMTDTVPWADYNQAILSVVMEPGVTSIGEEAFRDCSNLASVTIPEGVTSIGWGAFGCCNSLTSVTIPESVTSIGGWAFQLCSNLRSVEIKGAASIGDSAFYYCERLADVTFSGNVTSISDRAFSDCRRLTNVVLPESVTDIGAEAFYYCERLTSVAMPGVVNIGDSAFSGCHSLTGVIIPDSVINIGKNAFSSCNLTSVTIPDSVEHIEGNAFHGCSNLERILVDSNNSAYASADGILFSKDYTALIAYPAAKKDTVYEIPKSVMVIGFAAFSDSKNLSNVMIPESVTSIGAGAFYNCAKLTNVNIPRGVTHIEELTFSCCFSLTSLKIPEYVTSIGEWAFAHCIKLSSVTIPGSVANIEQYSFYSCSNLTSIVINDGVKSIGENAFEGCSNLTSIVIADGVKSIGENAFENCRKLIKLWLPKTVTFIDYEAFSGCANLKNVYYGGSNSDWNAITIEDGNAALENAKRTYDVTETPGTEIRPVNTTSLTSGGKVTLTAWAMPDNKKIKANWSLSEDSKAYASISSSGVLTAKNVNEVQNITVVATPTDGSPEARKEIQILPKITVKQAEKFNLFHSYSRVELAITGGTVDCALLDGNKDFVLENENDHFYIRFANPENPPAKPNTKATLQVFFPGSDTPATKALTISTTNTAPKLKLNPTSSILNTTLVDGLTVEAEVLGTEDESLEAWSTTKGVTATVKSGKLVVTLDTKKTTTATIYLKGNDWAKEVKLTHRITVTEKKPTVKFTAKGKLDVLNPDSEIVYTPKLTNAAGTIESVRLEGQDANLFNAEVVDGLVHLTMKADCKYATKKIYKVMPVVTLLGKDITGPTLSVKVTQSALKLAKIPNQTVSKSSPEDLTVNIKITSPLTAEIGDVQLNAKTTAALRNALKAAGGINFEADTVTFPASAFAALKPGKYSVILDVTPANAASDTKPIQAKFTLTVQK